MGGAYIIRAYGYQPRFVRKLERLIDENSALFITQRCTTAWLGFYLELTSAFFLMTTLTMTVAFRDSVSPAYAGMCLFNVFSIPGAIYFLTLNLSELENTMISFERASALTTILSEAPRHRHMDKGGHLANWPDAGAITFSNY
jgi:hypothetical protein